MTSTARKKQTNSRHQQESNLHAASKAEDDSIGPTPAGPEKFFLPPAACAI